VLDGQRGNPADGVEGRWPWRRVAVPGEGPANRRGYHAHEHQGAKGKRSPYLDRVKRRRGVLSMMRPSLGGAGEGRLGVRQFRRGEWPGLDRIKLWSKGRR
jgi:hypothetical protein